MATKVVFSSRATMFRTVIAAVVCAVSAFSPTLADVNITESVVLDADADWRGQGVVNIAQGATLDLRGHSLRVSGIAGDGTITSDYGITPLAAPSIVTDSSIFWLDAADESTIAMDMYGNVTSWTSKSGDRRAATTQNASYKPVYQRFAYGRPCVDFGEIYMGTDQNVGVDMVYSQFTDIKTAFFVFKIAEWSFFLGGSDYHFHRGGYAYSGSRIGKAWNGLDAVGDLENENVPSDSFQTVAIEMKVNQPGTSDRLCRDNRRNVAQRTGGRQLCEVILFNTTLTDEQRTTVTTYLQNKWAAYDAVQTRGDLCVDVAGTAANTSVALAGNLRFVKEGAGTFTAVKTGQNYEGGTVVSNGVLSLASAIGSGYNMPTGQYRSEVHISSNAVFEINGVYNMDMHHFVLDGGTLRNSVAQRNRNGGIGTVALTADSTFDLKAHTSFYVGSGVCVDLGGHKLTIDLDYNGARAYNFGTCVYMNGLVDIVSGGMFNVDTGVTGATNVDFRVNSALGITGTLNVRDYTALYPYKWNSGTGTMNVYGTFTPVDANYFYGCTMQDGSTIDLSAKTGAWNSTAKSDSDCKRTVGFASGATVTVNLAGRALVRGDKIIEWTSHPDGVTFVFDAATAESGVSPVITDDGLYYGAEDRVVTIAHWTGAAGDGDVSNAANWACTNAVGREVQNAVPGAYAKVYVAGDVACQLPSAGLLEYVELHIGDITLTADCDWRGLGANFNIDGKIDLNGHKLYLSGVPASGTITSDNSAGMAELHIDVAQGATVQNSGVAFTDRMKVVKDGAGTFIASKTGQTYVGGTVVTSGTLKTDANSYVGSTHAFGGIGAVITATTNETSVGTFDMNGVVGMHDIGYVVKLAGGTLKSSSQDINNKTGQMGRIALEADSTLLVERTCALGVPWNTDNTTRLNLGGKTLTIHIANGKTFTMSATTVDEGVLVANGPGTLHFGNAYTKAIGIAATNAHFRVNCPISTELNDGVGVDVGTYEALYSGTANGGANPLRVFGTFKPSAHDCFRGCTLMDGATLDLSLRTNALPLVSGFASGANTLAFADGATISVRLGDGRFPGGKVISWEAGSAPGNVDTLKFTSVGGERKRHFAVKDDGLYAHVGFVLVIR